jgi:hypothetical protein
MYKNVPNHQPDCHNVFSGCSRFPKLLTLKIATSPVHVLFPCYCEESHQNRPKDIGYIMSLIPLCRYLRHCWKNPNCEWWKAVKTQQGGHVPPVMFMFHHVSPCFTMFHHPTTSIPHINPNLEAFIRRGTCCLKSWKKQIQSARSMQWGNRLSASKAQHSGRFEQKLTTKNPNSWTYGNWVEDFYGSS